MDHGHLDEITSLNADDLHVEELEQRLEMALAAPVHLGQDGRAPAPIDDNGCTNFNCVNNNYNPNGCSGFTCQQYKG